MHNIIIYHLALSPCLLWAHTLLRLCKFLVSCDVIHGNYFSVGAFAITLTVAKSTTIALLSLKGPWQLALWWGLELSGWATLAADHEQLGFVGIQLQKVACLDTGHGLLWAMLYPLMTLGNWILVVGPCSTSTTTHA